MEDLHYGGHFSKIIKVNKIKYILIQDELIGEDETSYKKKFGTNRFKLPQQETSSKAEKFFDAHSDPISTIPRTLEEHLELDSLN
ncbi:hypothetical protein RhiirC2_779890 [Rhizophagus irregularis]|uniref:Uncharacterized protein n=1 Tax=Rhizophagus irregularis TaxID=588596 RepID=A0A2N1N8T1_9GLOM|nr:hypothetical protein RhiirC2_779890 [Rhizophagus irregularis]